MEWSQSWLAIDEGGDDVNKSINYNWDHAKDLEL